MNKIFETKDELLSYARESINKPFGEIDLYNRISEGKGSIGHIMEESYFGYDINNKHEADFKDLGIELKVTPFIKTKSGYRSKERLVLGIIRYCKENLDDFENSEFWMKNKELLIMFYEHNCDLPKELWAIFDLCLYSFPEEDLDIIKNDWRIITSKIKSGLAHEISESDTLYLGACTKGTSAETSYIKQPFSEKLAKQRAYSFKTSYMTYLLNTYIFSNEKHERVIKDLSNLKSMSFEQIIYNTCKPYFGMTQSELTHKLNINSNSNKSPKDLNSLILSKIFKLNGDIQNTEEFIKGHLITKSIRIEHNNVIKESMSFPYFEFKDIISQQWEVSDIFLTLSEARFVFILFQRTESNDSTSIFKDIKFWSMPEDNLTEVEKCWKSTREIILDGVKLSPSNRGIQNNLPKTKDNKVAHVRPHARNSAYRFDDISIGKLSDASQLPDGRWMTKQCFWLNSAYLRNVLRKLLK